MHFSIYNVKIETVLLDIGMRKGLKWNKKRLGLAQITNFLCRNLYLPELPTYVGRYLPSCTYLCYLHSFPLYLAEVLLCRALLIIFYSTYVLDVKRKKIFLQFLKIRQMRKLHLFDWFWKWSILANFCFCNFSRNQIKCETIIFIFDTCVTNTKQRTLK